MPVGHEVCRQLLSVGACQKKNNKGKRIGGEVGQIFDLFEIFNNFEIGHFIVRPRDEIV